MTQPFKKAVCWTDIHFGLRNNSRAHNDDCENFIKWMTEEAHREGAETAIFLGDWHNNRSNINVSTLNYTSSNIKYLSENFEHVYIIMGNHDLAYREKSEINSLPFGGYLPIVTLVNEILTVGDMTIVPWLVGDEWQSMKRLKSRYVFGHFELPKFKMNAMVEMPDHGGLNAGHFPNQELVFSGHFHKRQQQGNVVYMGNCFPHNYADAWDDERGCMFLEYGGQPDYRRWPNAPKFRTLTLTEAIDKHESLFDTQTFARVTIDVDISYEEATYIKEQWVKEYGMRELALIPGKKEEHSTEWSGGELQFESVDAIVLNQIQAIDSDVIDKQMLAGIYQGLTR
jgi:DNA repair exonuclease SbcCD nuclease subunit